MKRETSQPHSTPATDVNGRETRSKTLGKGGLGDDTIRGKGGLGDDTIRGKGKDQDATKGEKVKEQVKEQEPTKGEKEKHPEPEPFAITTAQQSQLAVF